MCALVMDGTVSVSDTIQESWLAVVERPADASPHREERNKQWTIDTSCFVSFS